jgi:hypothetical protein
MPKPDTFRQKYLTKISKSNTKMYKNKYRINKARQDLI